MVITYIGKQFFKITQGELTLAFNPVSKESSLNSGSKFGADLAFITTNHPDYNGVDQLSHGEKSPFVISGPGDYEVKEIFVKGVMSRVLIDKKKFINTTYLFTLDGIQVAFLGALSNDGVSKETREAMSDTDILFIPVGGKEGSEELLDPKAAAKLAASLEPKLIIPMDYDEVTLKSFLKELGEDKIAPVDKLTLKRKDLEGKESEVVVLSQS